MAPIRGTIGRNSVPQRGVIEQPGATPRGLWHITAPFSVPRRGTIQTPRGEIAESQYHFLWPNLTININPGFPNLSVDVWLPDGPYATRGFSEQFFGPGVSEDFAQSLIAFNKQVALEDDELTDYVQRGLMGGLPERGRFLANSEQLVIHFQKMVVRALSGSSPL